MLYKFFNSINERVFSLYLNEKNINLKSKRIKNFKDFINYLIKSNEIKYNFSYFIYNEKNFSSFGLSEKIDVVWVDWDGKVIHIEESFNCNKISKKIDNTKFIYIFKRGVIKEKKIIYNDIITHIYKRK